MTPTGLKARVAAQSETKTAEYMRTHKPAMEDIRKRAGKAAEKLKGKRGSDELLRLNSSGGYVIDGRSSKWGVPVNEQQQALIDHDKLGKVARPGLFYNRATTEQRMLVSEEARFFHSSRIYGFLYTIFSSSATPASLNSSSTVTQRMPRSVKF